jgi:hypothetical protein
MNHNMRRTVGRLAGGVGLVLLIALTGALSRPPAPLTAVEKRLVGDWSQVDLPGGETLCDITFGADRTFHANDGQFVGHWRINSGRLHVRYYSADWREHWFDAVRLWNAVRRDAMDVDIRFVGDRDRVELAEPQGPSFRALIGLSRFKDSGS